MSLQGALSTAVTGLRSTQVGIDLIARNIANADTPGYTAKSQRPVAQSTNGQVVGVSPGLIQREVDAFVQQQLRTEIGIGSQVDVKAEFLSRIDQLLGRPGDVNALDTLFNDFGESLQALISSPDQVGARSDVVSDAVTITQQLNRLSTEIQEMRQQSEIGIADAVDRANNALQQIARLNSEIQNSYESSPGIADIQDERDRYIDELSTLMDIQVGAGRRGAVTIYTGGGNLLVDVEATTLYFDARTSIDSSVKYSLDEDERGVGTLRMTTLGGAQLDLFRHGAINSGEIAGYRELRDNTLVQAQAQLDELAHGLALALSTKVNSGTAATVGAQNGFDLDVAGLTAGNEISVTYTQSPPGTPQTVTFLRVDDPATLPLTDDVTANPNDRVVGIDFSGGFASAIAAIDAELGGSITVSSPSADTIRILDDGVAGTVSIDEVGARVTPSSTQDDGLQLPLFMDLNGTYQTYSGSLDGKTQKLGFAQRIAVNNLVVTDNSLLVQHSTSPQTGSNDPARPLDLYDRFAESPFTFSPNSGIGGSSAPFSGSISDYAQRVINFQSQQAANVQREQDGQTIVIDTLQNRFDAETKVDVDTELARLLELQNAYGANARVMSVVADLLELLVNV